MMHLTMIAASLALLSLLPTFGTAAPAPPGLSKRQESLIQAVNNWHDDTGKVSAFLDSAGTGTLSVAQVKQQAAPALAAEKDELNHKAVIDKALLATNAKVQAANDELVNQNSFQDIVDELGDLTDNGNVNSLATLNQIRCTRVLPSIDEYMAAALAAAGSTQVVTAVRPKACASIKGSK